jgi:hypothetical protein
MCSTMDAQLGRICRAIEELAARSASGDGAPRRTAPVAAPDDIARLAAIWDMIAAADPELAKRLPGYLTPPD